MDQEGLANLRARHDEASAKADRLVRRPAALREDLRAAEEAGDVGSADQIEAELAALVGAIEAARTRANILAAVLVTAEQAARQAEAEAEKAVRERALWRSQAYEDSSPPRSPEAQAAADRRAANMVPKRAFVDVRGGHWTPPITLEDAEWLARQNRR